MNFNFKVVRRPSQPFGPIHDRLISFAPIFLFYETCSSNQYTTSNDYYQNKTIAQSLMFVKTNQNILFLSHFVKLQNRQKSDITGSVNYSTVFNSKVHGCFKLFEQLSKRLQMFDL
jgi:hypothetical protein